MCEPTTIAAAASSAASAASTATAAATAASSSTWVQGATLAIKGVSALGQSGAAVAKANEQNRAYLANAQAAKDAYFVKTKQNNLRLVQEQRQASQQKRDADLKAMKSQSTANAAAAGAGVQGVDVDRLINDFERSEGVMADRINQKLEDTQAQTEMQNLAFQSEAQSRINSMQPANFAETMFGVIEPLAGFGIDFLDAGAEMNNVEN